MPLARLASVCKQTPGRDRGEQALEGIGGLPAALRGSAVAGNITATLSAPRPGACARAPYSRARRSIVPLRSSLTNTEPSAAVRTSTAPPSAARCDGPSAAARQPAIGSTGLSIGRLARVGTPRPPRRRRCARPDPATWRAAGSVFRTAVRGHSRRLCAATKHCRARRSSHPSRRPPGRHWASAPARGESAAPEPPRRRTSRVECRPEFSAGRHIRHRWGRCDRQPLPLGRLAAGPSRQATQLCAPSLARCVRTPPSPGVPQGNRWCHGASQLPHWLAIKAGTAPAPAAGRGSHSAATGHRCWPRAPTPASSPLFSPSWRRAFP